MHVTGISHPIFTKVTSWAAGQVKHRTQVLTNLVKKLVNIRSSSARLTKKNVSASEEALLTTADTDDNMADPVAGGKAGSATGCGLFALIKSLIGFNANSHNLQTDQYSTDNNAYRRLPELYTPYRKLGESPIDSKTLFDESVNLILRDLKRVPDKEFHDPEWRSQEEKTHIPAVINRTIDLAYRSIEGNIEKISLLKQKKQDIMKQTLEDTGLWSKFSARDDLLNCAQISLVNNVALFFNKQQTNDAQLNQKIAHRVYETIFDCPGIIEQVIQRAEINIDKALAGRS